MKKPWLAFLFSFFLPGAGLWYLGKTWPGIVNLLVVLAIGLLCAFLLPEEVFEKYRNFITMGCAGGSGGLAQAIAAHQIPNPPPPAA